MSGFTLWISIFFVVVLILAIIVNFVRNARQQLVVKTKFDLDDVALKERAKRIALYLQPQTAKLRLASLAFGVVFVVGAIATYFTSTSADYPDPTWVYLAVAVMLIGALVALFADGAVSYAQQKKLAEYQTHLKEEKGAQNELMLLPAESNDQQQFWMIRGAIYVALLGLVFVLMNLALSTVLI